MTAYRAFFATTSLCTGLLLASLATPAWSADQTPETPPSGQPTGAPPKPQPQATEQPSTTVSELVVTGSRIKTTTFNSPAPITVITSQQAELQGNVDTAQVLQLSAVAASATQVNAYYSGF